MRKIKTTIYTALILVGGISTTACTNTTSAPGQKKVIIETPKTTLLEASTSSHD